MESTKHWTEENFQLNLKEPKNFASCGGHTNRGAKVYISNLEKNNGKLKVIFKAYFNFISHLSTILKDFFTKDFKENKEVEITQSNKNNLVDYNFKGENFNVTIGANSVRAGRT